MSYMVTQPNKGPPSPTGSERAAQPTIQPGLVLSFLLIENMLWKQQLCSLTSQEMVNINFGKIRKTAKNEAAGRKRSVFFIFMLLSVLISCRPGGRRTACQLRLPLPLGLHHQPPR